MPATEEAAEEEGARGRAPTRGGTTLPVAEGVEEEGAGGCALARDVPPCPPSPLLLGPPPSLLPGATEEAEQPPICALL
jgi:hypothetical protein